MIVNSFIEKRICWSVMVLFLQAGFSFRYLKNFQVFSVKIDLEATQNRPFNPTGPGNSQGAGHDRVRHQLSFVACIFHLQIIHLIPSLLYFVVIGIYTFTCGCLLHPHLFPMLTRCSDLVPLWWWNLNAPAVHKHYCSNWVKLISTRVACC